LSGQTTTGRSSAPLLLLLLLPLLDASELLLLWAVAALRLEEDGPGPKAADDDADGPSAPATFRAE
jgi:hypothetical protein